jgi:hypothetical protein
MPYAFDVAGSATDLTRLVVFAPTRKTSNSPCGGVVAVVADATAKSVPGKGRIANGLPSAATTASGDCNVPTVAVDDEQASVGTGGDERDTVALPHASTPDSRRADTATHPVLLRSCADRVTHMTRSMMRCQSPAERTEPLDAP